MYSLTTLAEQLREETLWQKTPQLLHMSDYEDMIVKAVKKLYLDTGRASVYHSDLITKEIDEDGDKILVLNRELPLDEELYVLIVAKIFFFQRVQNDVNNLMGYSTNALTVTNADKPYQNLKDSIDNLERQRRINYYKMVRYVIAQ